MLNTKQYHPRIPLALFILVGLFALALSYTTAYWKKESIELELTQKVRKALSDAGLPLVKVDFDGRAASLSGLVNETAIQANIEATVNQVSGVRTLSSQIKTQPLSTALTPPPPATFKEGLYIPPNDHPLEKYNLSTVQFVHAKADLMPESLPALDRLAMLLKQNPQIQIELSVHTDNQGTVLGQMAVTQVRAQALRTYLLEQGVQDNQLSSVGYGATRPVAPNTGEAGRAQNRRVQLTVLKDG